jgi:hypothetical protein
MSLDLEAIRARNDDIRRQLACTVALDQNAKGLSMSAEGFNGIVADIDTLIAEVERLREAGSGLQARLGEYAAVIRKHQEAIDFLLNRWERWGPPKPTSE